MISSIPQGITENRDTDPGKYLWDITTFEKKFQENSGRLFFNTQLRCVMPQTRLGRFHFESFWIGTEDDPNGDHQQTWLDSLGAKQWKSFCKVAGVPFDGQDPEVIMANLVGRQIGGHVERVLSKKDKKHYTNVTKWYAPGSFEPIIDAPTVESAPPVANPAVAPPVTPGVVQQAPPMAQSQVYAPPVPQAAVPMAQPIAQGGVSQQPGYAPPVVTQVPVPTGAPAVPGAVPMPTTTAPQVAQPAVPQAAPVAQPAVVPAMPQVMAESIPCAVCIGQGKTGADAAVLLSDMDAHVTMHANEQA